ncbi:uncharacterized protein LOC141534749 [Cotesia typhae]|uniref:uncharacterized protein LOC141534749 n=1 Tax=Cotesia typhae TaxID=2053667 RepID=UPI003D690F42
MPSLGVWAASVVGGAAFVGLTGYGFRSLIKTTVVHSPHYHKAMEYLYAHEESKQLLGEPIQQVGSMNVGDKKYFGEYKTLKYYTVPVQGSKFHGNLTYWITQINDNTSDKNNNNNNSNNNEENNSNSKYVVKKVLLEVLTKPRKIVWVKNDNKT